MNILIFVAISTNFKIGRFVNETSFFIKYCLVIGLGILLNKAQFNL